MNQARFVMKDHPIKHAFEITEEDVLSVLRANWARVTNTDGMSFEAMAEMLLPKLDADLAAQDALRGNDMESQTTYAQAEIHRQLWEMGTLERAPDILAREISRPAIVRRLQEKFTSQDPFTLQDLAREGFKGFDKMTDQELACEAARFGVYHELDYHFRVLDTTLPNFIHGHWTHIFGPGQRETMLRIVFDATTNTLIAAQHAYNGQWHDLNSEDRLDVEDSIKNANSEALECPAEFGLLASHHLPDWACITSSEVEHVRNSPRG